MVCNHLNDSLIRAVMICIIWWRCYII